MSDPSIESYPPAVIHEFAPVAHELLACDSRVALLRGEGAQVIAAGFAELVETCEPKVLSFDVFDTFLLRNDKAEAARYFELSEQVSARLKELALEGREPPSALDLLVARIDAIKLSYRIRPAVDGCREGHIKQIIRIMRRSLDLPLSAENAMLESELAYEAANLVPNPVLLDAAVAFRRDGGKVILVSDMYLGGAEIADIIRRLDDKASQAIDAIFSSADHSVSKASGKIFAMIQRELDLPSEAFLHVGDAWHGDVQRCRQAGWSTLHFPIARAELARREESLTQALAELKQRGHNAQSWAKL